MLLILYQIVCTNFGSTSTTTSSWLIQYLFQLYNKFTCVELFLTEEEALGGSVTTYNEKTYQNVIHFDFIIYNTHTLYYSDTFSDEQPERNVKKCPRIL